MSKNSQIALLGNPNSGTNSSEEDRDRARIAAQNMNIELKKFLAACCGFAQVLQICLSIGEEGPLAQQILSMIGQGENLQNNLQVYFRIVDLKENQP